MIKVMPSPQVPQIKQAPLNVMQSQLVAEAPISQRSTNAKRSLRKSLLVSFFNLFPYSLEAWEIL